MAMSMTDKATARSSRRAEVAERRCSRSSSARRENHNGCVGSELRLGERPRAGVDDPPIKPGQRFGFHRHRARLFLDLGVQAGAAASI